jgi:S-adenosylmethionine hydrolase
MTDPIITLTTDFGEDSPYVAAMKGVILGINAAARIVDLSHQIPPQDVRAAAFFLKNAVPFFPQGVIHVIVVDPGVGTERALLCVDVAGQRLLVPDNGCWTTLVSPGCRPAAVIRLTQVDYWRGPVSATFHGRDILAPVAAHLSLGIDYRRLGVPVEQWVQLTLPRPSRGPQEWSGEVVFVDHFGNLFTNIPGAGIQLEAGVRLKATIGNAEVSPIWVRSYAAVPADTLVALISSSGDLEIAVTEGNAARQLRAGPGTRVEVSFP